MEKPHLDKILEELNIRTTDGEPVTPKDERGRQDLFDKMKEIEGDLDQLLERMMNKTKMKFYILVDKKLKEVPFKEHRDWFMKSEERLFVDYVKGIKISTVFLPIDTNFAVEAKDARLFETMVFGGKYDTRSMHYVSYEKAEIGHRLMCNIVQNEQK